MHCTQSLVSKIDKFYYQKLHLIKPSSLLKTFFQVKDEILVERIAGRMIHQSSGRTYHEGLTCFLKLAEDEQWRLFDGKLTLKHIVFYK